VAKTLLVLRKTARMVLFLITPLRPA